MTVENAIKKAERILPGKPAPAGARDPRWHAMIAIADFIPSDPEPIWSFVERWGKHPSEDLRSGVACVVLEHLLEYHFDLIFPRIVPLARESKRFEFTFKMCRKFGQATEPRNALLLDRLRQDLWEQRKRSRRRTLKCTKRRN
jgi:hypothetical protein